MPLGLAALTVGLILVRRQTGLPAGPAAVGVMFGVPLLVCYTFIDRPLRFALGVSALLLAALMAPGVHGRVAHQERSYFGVHRVTQDDAGEYRMLVHGNTIHGRQSLDPCRRGEPLSYYHKHGPMGSLFEVFHESHPRGRVAVVGLGAGALAAYGRPGQEFTFYEIDPAVIRIAQKYFTYLDDSRARVRTVAGDARLTLAGAAQGRYDLIVVDAFSSDAIPLHLLTREALRLYLSRLARDGLLAFHISNRYLNLEPVLANLAADAGLVCRVRRDQFVRPPDQKLGAAPSVWVVMARREQDLGRIASSAFWEKVRPRPAEPVWTDDFSNVLSVFSWGGGRDE
jgi:spermidine synthase